MRARACATLGLALWAGIAAAQLTDLDPDWKEIDVPPPPAFKTSGLVSIEMPRHVSVKFGVDPESLRITDDGIVRYVMVATSPGGNVNAMYEGIRCLTGEVKTYARYGASSRWSPLVDPQWKPLNDNQPSMHALAFARQGACDGRAAAARSPLAIIGRLKNPSADNARR